MFAADRVSNIAQIHVEQIRFTTEIETNIDRMIVPLFLPGETLNWLKTLCTLISIYFPISKHIINNVETINRTYRK